MKTHPLRLGVNFGESCLLEGRLGLMHVILHRFSSCRGYFAHPRSFLKTDVRSRHDTGCHGELLQHMVEATRGFFPPSGDPVSQAMERIRA